MDSGGVNLNLQIFAHLHRRFCIQNRECRVQFLAQGEPRALISGSIGLSWAELAHHHQWILVMKTVLIVRMKQIPEMRPFWWLTDVSLIIGCSYLLFSLWSVPRVMSNGALKLNFGANLGWGLKCWQFDDSICLPHKTKLHFTILNRESRQQLDGFFPLY